MGLLTNPYQHWWFGILCGFGSTLYAWFWYHPWHGLGVDIHSSDRLFSQDGYFSITEAEGSHRDDTTRECFCWVLSRSNWRCKLADFSGSLYCCQVYRCFLDVPGFPPTMENEFCIELLPGTTPIHGLHTGCLFHRKKHWRNNLMIFWRGDLSGAVGPRGALMYILLLRRMVPIGFALIIGNWTRILWETVIPYQESMIWIISWERPSGSSRSIYDLVHQLYARESNIPKIVFVTCYGSYEFVVMPFRFLRLRGRLVIPNDKGLRKEILDKGHKSWYSVYPRETKMWRDLKHHFLGRKMR